MSARQFVQYYSADLSVVAPEPNKRAIIYPFVLDSSFGFKPDYIGCALFILDINQAISPHAIKLSKLRLQPLYQDAEAGQTLYLLDPVIKKIPSAGFAEEKEMLYYPDISFLIGLLEIIPSKDYRTTPEEIHQRFIQALSPKILKAYHQDINSLKILAKTAPLPNQKLSSESLDQYESILYESFFGRFIINGLGHAWHETSLEDPNIDKDLGLLHPGLFLRTYIGDSDQIIKNNERILFNTARMMIAYAEKGICLDVIDRLKPAPLKKLNKVFFNSHHQNIHFLDVGPYFKLKIAPATKQTDAENFVQENLADYLQMAHLERCTQVIMNLYGLNPNTNKEECSQDPPKLNTPSPDVFFDYARWVDKHEKLLALLYNSLKIKVRNDQVRVRFSLKNVTLILSLLRNIGTYQAAKYTSLKNQALSRDSTNIAQVTKILSADACMDLAWLAGEFSLTTLNGRTVAQIAKTNLFFENQIGSSKAMIPGLSAPTIKHGSGQGFGKGDPYMVLCNLRAAPSENPQDLPLAQLDAEGLWGNQNPLPIKDRELARAASLIVRFDELAKHPGAYSYGPEKKQPAPDFRAQCGIIITPLDVLDESVLTLTSWLGYYYDRILVLSLSPAVSKNYKDATLLVFRDLVNIPSDALASQTRRRLSPKVEHRRIDNDRAFYQVIKDEIQNLVYEPLKENYLRTLGFEEPAQDDNVLLAHQRQTNPKSLIEANLEPQEKTVGQAIMVSMQASLDDNQEGSVCQEAQADIDQHEQKAQQEETSSFDEQDGQDNQDGQASQATTPAQDQTQEKATTIDETTKTGLVDEKTDDEADEETGQTSDTDIADTLYDDYQDDILNVDLYDQANPVEEHEGYQDELHDLEDEYSLHDAINQACF